MEFSVVIPTYKRKETLLRLLSLLGESSRQINLLRKGEVIVAEQAPFLFTEEEISREKKKLPFLRWVRIDKVNLPLARNTGILLSRGEIIIFLDDDLEIDRGFIQAYLDFFANTEEDIVAATGCLIQPNLKGLTRFFEGIAPFFNPLSGVIYGGFNLNRNRRVETVKGGNAAFRKKSLYEIGGFDFNFEVVALREEADIVERLKKKGGRVFYIPQAKAIHRQAEEGGERQEKYSEILYWGRRSESLFVAKNFSFFTWMGFYFFGSLVAFLRGLAAFQPFNYLAKAHQGIIAGRKIAQAEKKINFLDYTRENVKWKEI